MIEKDKKEFRSIICDAIDEVISPQLEEIREDLSGVKDDLSSLKEQNNTDHQEIFHSLDRIERKLDSNISRTDDHSVVLNQHHKRLTKLETKT